MVLLRLAPPTGCSAEPAAGNSTAGVSRTGPSSPRRMGSAALERFHRERKTRVAASQAMMIPIRTEMLRTRSLTAQRDPPAHRHRAAATTPPRGSDHPEPRGDSAIGQPRCTNSII